MADPEPSESPKPSFLKARAASFRNAGRGVAFMLRTQHNAWIHASLTVAVVGAALAFDVSATEWCLLVLAMASVWTAESFNTALEIIVDIASPERRPAAGRAKDVAAGAVLLCSVGAAVVGAVIFLPRLIEAIGVP